MPDLRPDGDLAERSASASPASFCSPRVCSACSCDAACLFCPGSRPGSTCDAVEPAESPSLGSRVFRAACPRASTGVCAACIRATCFFASGDGDEPASGDAKHAADGQSAVSGPRTDAFPRTSARSRALPSADLQHGLSFRSRWSPAEAKSRPAADEHRPSRRRNARTSMECRADGRQPGQFAPHTGFWTLRRSDALSGKRAGTCRTSGHVVQAYSWRSRAAHPATRRQRAFENARHDRPARRWIAPRA